MIREALDKGEWLAAGSVARAFVRHSNSEPSSAVYMRIPLTVSAPKVSIVIPTLDAQRGLYFERLLEQLEHQTLQNFEVLIIRGDPRQGRAINIGASLAQAPYLVTLDDDTSLPQTDTIERLVTVMLAHPEIGIAGGNAVVPPDASPFVRRVLSELPRRAWKPVLEITDSDLAQHPCMIMRTEEFKAIGGENELIPRGLDPYLREEFRKTGKRVVLIPGVVYYHLPPDSWRRLLRQFHRNGRHAAYVNRHYPQWAIETPARHGEFRKRVPLLLRLLRLPIRILISFLRGRFIRVLCESAYAAGFAAGWILHGRRKRTEAVQLRL